MSDLLKYAGTADLKPGDRVRHRLHTNLTGTVKCYEWNAPGVLSGIPYNIAWDDSGRAADVLGMFWIYAGDYSVEKMADAA